MKIKTGKAKIIGLFVFIILICAVTTGGIFFMKNREFSFQDLKRSDIRAIAFNTREDFYYTLNDEETDEIYKELKEITREDSGAEEVDLSSGIKVRLSLKNGEEIMFMCSGHTLVMEKKAYYVEGNTLEAIQDLCEKRLNSLEKENENRTEFSDLTEENVRYIKVYEGSSLCYSLNEEEKREILDDLRKLKLNRAENGTADKAENGVDNAMGPRCRVEKEDGMVVEFSVDNQSFSMHNKNFSISEEDGKAFKSRLETWLQAVREETRQTPFKDLNTEAVKRITVNNPAWAEGRELTQEEQRELLALLCQLVLIGEGTDDYVGREGLVVEGFQIEKEDGVKITISPSQDPFVMNGKGYVIENADAAKKLAEMYEAYSPGE